MKRKGTARLTLRPGDPGTRAHVAKYGPALVAVRYRYDEARAKRYTTVELIVDEVRWVPERHIVEPDRLVGLRIGPDERQLQRQLRGVQARWDPPSKLWWARLRLVVQLGLEERISEWAPPSGTVSNSR